MLASHNLYVKKDNCSIIEELEGYGYIHDGAAKGLTGTTFFFVQDVNRIIPVDRRVSTYTITVKENISDQWYAPCNIDKILYVAHPDREVVEIDRRSNYKGNVKC